MTLFNNLRMFEVNRKRMTLDEVKKDKGLRYIIEEILSLPVGCGYVGYLYFVIRIA